jgi:hypothetical protein
MSQDACRPPIAGFRSRVTHRADHVAPELRAKPDRAGATLGRTPAYGCRFRKLHPSEWRRQPNQNMIAVDDRNWPAFRPVAAASGSGGGWKPKYGYCGTSSMSCSSAHHVECTCVGPTVLCSFGSIVAVLSYLTPFCRALASSGFCRLLAMEIPFAREPTADRFVQRKTPLMRA